MKTVCRRFHIKATYREKALSKKTTALMKSMIIDIWVVGTSNPLFVMRGF